MLGSELVFVSEGGVDFFFVVVIVRQGGVDLPLVLPIDHVLVSEHVRVLEMWTGPDIGSDHYPLVLDAGF